jgi:tetratricopeptide (TPR) repeat protein
MLQAALELYADLTFAQGEFEEAARMYERLAGGDWPEVAFQSRLMLGRSLMLQEKFDEAIAAFENIAAIDSAEDYALHGKTIAECLKAQSMAMAGQAEAAESMALEIIRNADAANSNLMARAYNALGASHLQQGELKEAAQAWLHTDLLFVTDPDAHAEALWHLSQLWPQLDHEDRALEARQEIRDRYRNSFWAARVAGNSE